MVFARAYPGGLCINKCESTVNQLLTLQNYHPIIRLEKQKNPIGESDAQIFGNTCKYGRKKTKKKSD